MLKHADLSHPCSWQRWSLYGTGIHRSRHESVHIRNRPSSPRSTSNRPVGASSSRKPAARRTTAGVWVAWAHHTADTCKAISNPSIPRNSVSRGKLASVGSTALQCCRFSMRCWNRDGTPLVESNLLWINARAMSVAGCAACTLAACMLRCSRLQKRLPSHHTVAAGCAFPAPFNVHLIAVTGLGHDPNTNTIQYICRARDLASLRRNARVHPSVHGHIA